MESFGKDAYNFNGLRNGYNDTRDDLEQENRE